MAEETDCRTEVAKSVTKEFNEFYAQEIKKSKEEIFYDYIKYIFIMN